ncbi:MAG: Asp-tRNA(Asn)/Glu-tRNA(Gln) amidotransferase subunit GatC [Candidatus Bathyarchaeota archaeon]
MKKTFQGFSEEEVEHIAWLARIELSEEEKKLFTLQLSTILDYFHIIDEANTEGVQPTLQVLNLVNVSREDVVEKSLKSDVALANAPMKDKGYFKAPRVL